MNPSGLRGALGQCINLNDYHIVLASLYQDAVGTYKVRVAFVV